MANEALLAPLMRVRLFQGLNSNQLFEIARQAERVVFRDGALLTEEGDTADAAILIVAGDTERVTAGVREQIEPGSLVGEMAMFVEHTYGSTVVARSTVRALRLPRSAMHVLMERDPALAEHIVSRISARLSVMLDDLRSVDGSLARHQKQFEQRLPPPVMQPDPRYLTVAMH